MTTLLLNTEPNGLPLLVGDRWGLELLTGLFGGLLVDIRRNTELMESLPGDLGGLLSGDLLPGDMSMAGEEGVTEPLFDLGDSDPPAD